MNGQTVSLVLAFVEPISVLMLVFLAVHYRDQGGMGWPERLCYIALAWGLGQHALLHFQLAFVEYRPPRSWSWLLVYGAINGLIWVRYLKAAVPKWRQNIQSNFGKREVEQ